MFESDLDGGDGGDGWIETLHDSHIFSAFVKGKISRYFQEPPVLYLKDLNVFDG
jgi:hypothetical protein